MRILQVTTSARRRGAEVFASQLAEDLTRRGHSVTTVSLEPPTQPHALDFEGLSRRRSDPRTLVALLNRARSNDVVVAHGGSTLIPVALAATAVRRPFVYRNIGDPSYWGRARGTGLRVGFPLRRAAHVMALNEGAADYMVRRYRLQRDRVTVASNAVDPSRFPRRSDEARSQARAALGINDDRVLLGYLGNLSAEKRPGWALDTVEALPDATLVIGGDGPLRGELDSRTRAMEDRDGAPTCRLLGQVTDPERFLTALDLLLLPSATEGIPGVLLEAALVGVPTVATDVGGVSEVIASVGGACVPADDRDGFIEATRRVIDEPEAHLPNRSAVVRDHGIDQVANRWEAVLTKTVDDHRR